MTERIKGSGALLESIRQTKPVVHSVTNYVVMNSTANALLAMGASPIMAHAAEEMEDLAKITNALVINIGTLSNLWIESMKMAGRIATVAAKPVVLDPVGAGATELRTNTAKEIIEWCRPTVIRGNASEILALSPEGAVTRGVDSAHSVEDAVEAARSIAQSLNTVIAVTGERDLVTDGERTLVVTGGDPLMAYVTGTGCAASVTVGAFLAVEDDAVLATASALAFFGLAGQRAGNQAKAPGSFWVKMLDELYTITPDDLEREARIEKV